MNKRKGKSQSFWSKFDRYGEAMNTTMKAPVRKDPLSLTGEPLDPHIISERALKTREKRTIMQKKRGLFNIISQKFAEASKWHISDDRNPTRKIKTNHLKVMPQIIEDGDDYHNSIAYNSSKLALNYQLFITQLHLKYRII
jgi:hypothetical protein